MTKLQIILEFLTKINKMRHHAENVRLLLVIKFIEVVNVYFLLL